jgi:hypothetical protein
MRINKQRIVSIGLYDLEFGRSKLEHNKMKEGSQKVAERFD